VRGRKAGAAKRVGVQHGHREGRRDTHAVRQRAVVAMVVVWRMRDDEIGLHLADQRFQRSNQRGVRDQRSVGEVEEARRGAKQAGRVGRFFSPGPGERRRVACSAPGAIRGYGEIEICALHGVGGHRTEHEYLDIVGMCPQRQYPHSVLPETTRA